MSRKRVPSRITGGSKVLRRKWVGVFDELKASGMSREVRKGDKQKGGTGRSSLQHRFVSQGKSF